MILACHAARRVLLCAALGSAMLQSSCRHHAPVTRHFLRIPAEYAGGLSSIHRAQWLKQSRKNLPDRKTLTATGHLVLPEISTLRGTVLRGIEVLHIHGSAGRGGLAVLTKPGDNPGMRPRLNLLTYDQAIYTNAGSEIEFGIAPAAWRVDPVRMAMVGFSGGGSPVMEVSWSGSNWRAHRLR